MERCRQARKDPPTIKLNAKHKMRSASKYIYRSISSITRKCKRRASAPLKCLNGFRQIHLDLSASSLEDALLFPANNNSICSGRRQQNIFVMQIRRSKCSEFARRKRENRETSKFGHQYYDTI